MRSYGGKGKKSIRLSVKRHLLKSIVNIHWNEELLIKLKEKNFKT